MSVNDEVWHMASDMSGWVCQWEQATDMFEETIWHEEMNVDQARSNFSKCELAKNFMICTCEHLFTYIKWSDKALREWEEVHEGILESSLSSRSTIN